jgi:hypothetical protein
MEKRGHKAAIRVVAVISAATGVFSIASSWSSYRHAGVAIPEGAGAAGLAVTVLLTAYLLIPILKIAAGLWLWTLRARAWYFAVAVLSADVFVLAVSIIRFHSAAHTLSGVPAEAMRGALVETHSLRPSYVIAALSIGSVLFLLRGQVRRWLEGRRM